MLSYTFQPSFLLSPPHCTVTLACSFLLSVEHRGFIAVCSLKNAQSDTYTRRLRADSPVVHPKPQRLHVQQRVIDSRGSNAHH
ncbi:hypothetical protein CEXT_1791 [Caerostris extrusa]|uniref:Secreted protein n=1 Tax=Caerostris extrusa TaxID=172846 RepID=A0AAV4X5D6_CAEEX|nr:hypothetical protein CEXT_1791 [Caerostris extrusa]